MKLRFEGYQLYNIIKVNSKMKLFIYEKHKTDKKMIGLQHYDFKELMLISDSTFTSMLEKLAEEGML